MEMSIKVIGHKIKNMELVIWYIQQVMSIMDNGLMTKFQLRKNENQLKLIKNVNYNKNNIFFF